MKNSEHITKTSRWTSSVYRYVFDQSNGHGAAKIFDRLISILIVASAIAVVLENTEKIYVGNESWFLGFDLISVGIFTVEYLLRIATAAHDPSFSDKRLPRLRYVFSIYGLVDLLAIAPFFVAHFVEVNVGMMRVLRVVRLARMFKLSRDLIPAWHEFQMLNEGRTLRAKIFALLEPTGHSGRLHRYVDDFIVFWIALSIFCVIFESVASIQEIFENEFYVIDMIAFTLFSIEYVARLYAAPENPKYKHFILPRWNQIKSGQALIDLFAILPFVLERLLNGHFDLRFLRVFRLMRMLKLTRYTSAIETLSKVLKREWQIIFASVFVLSLLIVFTASFGYLLEHQAQPDIFQNIPQAIYWAVTTLSSVGYGDITPITPLGRAMTVVVSLIGVGVFAIPAGLLASAFTDQLRIDREAFKKRLVLSFSDGVLDHAERESINAEVERLHLSQAELEELKNEALRELTSQANEALSLIHI